MSAICWNFLVQTLTKTLEHLEPIASLTVSEQQSDLIRIQGPTHDMVLDQEVFRVWVKNLVYWCKTSTGKKTMVPEASKNKHSVCKINVMKGTSLLLEKS